MDSPEDETKSRIALVVTADPDTGYALSLLRARGHHVVLLCPPMTDSNLLKVDPDLSFQGDMLEGMPHVAVAPSPSHVVSKGASPQMGPTPSVPGWLQETQRSASQSQVGAAQSGPSPAYEVQTPPSDSQQGETTVPKHSPYVLTKQAKAFIACSHAVQMCTDNGRRRCELFMDLPDKRVGIHDKTILGIALMKYTTDLS
jgi:hypothetical protein